MISEICGMTPEQLHVAGEDVAVGAEGDDALLDPRAARVVDADDRAADLAARSMTLHIFSAITSPSEPPKTVKSWEKTQTRRPSMVPCRSRPRRPTAGSSSCRSRRAMADERVELLEGAGIQELLDPLARGVLAALVLLGLRLRAGVDRRLAQLVQLGELLLEGLGGAWRSVMARRS
jgi:hypothetical protein